MERFVIIVNGFQSLTIITKHSILDVAAVLDPPLNIQSNSLYQNASNQSITALKCWICEQAHRLMQCSLFIDKTLVERNKVVNIFRLCWNCLSKSHQVSNCKSEHNCRICNKRHHSLLYHESESPVDTNAVVNNNQINNIPQKANKIFLQVIPGDVTMNGKTFKANALLDAGSDATLITKDLADKSCLQGPNQSLRFMNAIISSKTVSSNLVSFSLSSKPHPQHITVTNARVVEELDIPTPKFPLHHLSSQYPHLSNVPFTHLTEKISILTGADIPELHLHLNYKLGRPCEPVAIETKLGWVIFRGKQIQKDTLSTVISNKI